MKAVNEMTRDELNQAIMHGMKQIEDGLGLDGPTVMQELRQEISELIRNDAKFLLHP